jgi:hypothetical protein
MLAIPYFKEIEFRKAVIVSRLFSKMVRSYHDPSLPLILRPEQIAYVGLLISNDKYLHILVT